MVGRHRYALYPRLSAPAPPEQFRERLLALLSQRFLPKLTSGATSKSRRFRSGVLAGPSTARSVCSRCSMTARRDGEPITRCNQPTPSVMNGGPTTTSRTDPQHERSPRNTHTKAGSHRRPTASSTLAIQRTLISAPGTVSSPDHNLAGSESAARWDGDRRGLAGAVGEGGVVGGVVLSPGPAGYEDL
jgi:hypothetical protein